MKEKEEEFPIAVNSRIIRHISRGIYRSPAGALKELVSNSYDAGARKVTINTNYPNVDKIIATDNGVGMTLQDFKKIIQQIGISNKKLGQEIQVIDSNAKRKTIGNYGIGFLAMGQIAEEALITSKVKGSNKGFQARINFDQFEEPTSEILNNIKTKNFPIGTCYLKEVDFNENSNNEHFTKIELNKVRVDVRRKIKGDTTIKLEKIVEKQTEYISTFNDILKFVREKELGKDPLHLTKGAPIVSQYFYEKLLWELSVYAPLPYPKQSIFVNGKLKKFNELASREDFELVVDGFVLKKPFEDLFWENKEKYPQTIFVYENQKYYKNNRINAYIIFQENTMIRPKIMQGILIRENGVSVGLYDKTYLDYPFFQGTKIDHLTGEIYAEGLSQAMNVDRDSFNETDDAYIALAEWFHSKLYNEVFKTISKIQDEKRKITNKDTDIEFISNVLKSFITENKKINRILFKELPKKDDRRIIIEDKKLIVNIKHRDCKLNTLNREKLLFALSLILKDDITIKEFEDVSDELNDIKKEIK